MPQESKDPRGPIPEEINIGLTRAMGRPSRVLDVGCGVGLNGGVAKAMGAFVVGIALSGSYARDPRPFEIIGEFSYAVFTPIFFVSMAITADFIAGFDPWLVALITAVAFLGKISGVYAGGKLVGMADRQALAVGCGLNARGILGIVMAAAAFDAGKHPGVRRDRLRRVAEQPRVTDRGAGEDAHRRPGRRQAGGEVWLEDRRPGAAALLGEGAMGQDPAAMRAPRRRAIEQAGAAQALFQALQQRRLGLFAESLIRGLQLAVDLQQLIGRQQGGADGDADHAERQLGEPVGVVEGGDRAGRHQRGPHHVEHDADGLHAAADRHRRRQHQQPRVVVGAEPVFAPRRNAVAVFEDAEPRAERDDMTQVDGIAQIERMVRVHTSHSTPMRRAERVPFAPARSAVQLIGCRKRYVRSSDTRAVANAMQLSAAP